MSHHETAADCLNCGTHLEGTYCHACGQKAASMRVGVHDFAHEAAHEFLHLDGKILNTMKLLLFKPGQLTREFLDGRRVRYISPIRVYLTWSVLFFALAATLPSFRSSLVVVGSGGQRPRNGIVISGGQKPNGIVVEPREAPANRAAELKEAREAADHISETLVHQFPRAMFLLMPFFGLLTWLMYRKQEPFYVPHLYYSIHFHAFVFFALILAVLCGSLGGVGKNIGGIIFLTTFPYHYIGLRRMFGGTRLNTFLKGTLIGALYWAAVGATVGGLAYLAIQK